MPETGTNPALREDFSNDVLELSALVLATIAVQERERS
jgi:hypothetical protein